MYGSRSVGSPLVMQSDVYLSMTCLFAPLFLVKLGEQYGFVGIQVGLTALFGVLAGAFFFVALGWTGRPAKVRKVRTLSEDPDLF